jgi:hypothetical protein
MLSKNIVGFFSPLFKLVTHILTAVAHWLYFFHIRTRGITVLGRCKKFHFYRLSDRNDTNDREAGTQWYFPILLQFYWCTPGNGV